MISDTFQPISVTYDNAVIVFIRHIVHVISPLITTYATHNIITRVHKKVIIMPIKYGYVHILCM